MQEEIYFWYHIVILNKNIKLILNYFLGPLVFLFLAYSIHRQLLRQPDWTRSWDQIKKAVQGNRQWMIWVACLLMVVNWGLESKKWQLVIRQVQPISYWRAFCATLTGTTMASFTPNRIGEYLGRILYVEEGNRLSAVSLTIVCSIAQLIITLLAGVAGLLYLRAHLSQGVVAGRVDLHFWLNLLFYGVLAILAVLVFCYFRLPWLIGILEKAPFSSKILGPIKILEEFNATILVQILFLSFVRYLVFLVQYSLLFAVFGVSLSWLEAASGMSVVFLVMAVIPTFTFLTELGLRWEASIQIIELFSLNTVGIFAASFGIWLINLIIPALIGSLLILNIKLFRK